ncbi:hypothetical protein EVAR_38957_1 [Eumeta japonica]|uniref:Uncharacterized protein n=1 Tax=Eumeta variegata TaxID=151549 RepID=A0A4C1W7L4_EUMVA|nr:hypothetical protein EVAR_38957_1 [Eumeta japonica]
MGAVTIYSNGSTRLPLEYSIKKDISSEMLRGGGGMMVKLLYYLVNKFCKSHSVPNDGCIGVAVPFYEGKVSRQVRRTYRTVSSVPLANSI